jgi:hypothetical protein
MKAGPPKILFASNAASQFGPTSAQALPWFRLTSWKRELGALGGRGYDWKTVGCDGVSIFLAGDRKQRGDLWQLSEQIAAARHRSRRRRHQRFRLR